MDNFTFYIRVKCAACRGAGGLYCPYCEPDGKHFIEATEKTIRKWFEELDKKGKGKLRELLYEDE